MTIKFSNKEQEYIYTDEKDNCKLKCKINTPAEIKKTLLPKLETFNNWITELNGEEK